MCNITIDLNGKDPNQVYETAKEQASNHGSYNETGNRSLEFQISVPIVGKIEGNLDIQDTQALVTITKRPFLISCKQIESQLEKFITADIQN